MKFKNLVLFSELGVSYTFSHHCDYTEALNSGFYYKDNPVRPVDVAPIESGDAVKGVEEKAEDTMVEEGPAPRVLNGIRKKKVLKGE